MNPDRIGGDGQRSRSPSPQPRSDDVPDTASTLHASPSHQAAAIDAHGTTASPPLHLAHISSLEIPPRTPDSFAQQPERALQATPLTPPEEKLLELMRVYFDEGESSNSAANLRKARHHQFKHHIPERVFKELLAQAEREMDERIGPPVRLYLSTMTSVKHTLVGHEANIATRRTLVQSLPQGLQWYCEALPLLALLLLLQANEIEGDRHRQHAALHAAHQANPTSTPRNGQATRRIQDRRRLEASLQLLHAQKHPLRDALHLEARTLLATIVRYLDTIGQSQQGAELQAGLEGGLRVFDARASVSLDACNAVAAAYIMLTDAIRKALVPQLPPLPQHLRKPSRSEPQPAAQLIHAQQDLQWLDRAIAEFGKHTAEPAVAEPDAPTHLPRLLDRTADVVRNLRLKLQSLGQQGDRLEAPLNELTTVCDSMRALIAQAEPVEDLLEIDVNLLCLSAQVLLDRARQWLVSAVAEGRTLLDAVVLEQPEAPDESDDPAAAEPVELSESSDEDEPSPARPSAAATPARITRPATAPRAAAASDSSAPFLTLAQALQALSLANRLGRPRQAGDLASIAQAFERELPRVPRERRESELRQALAEFEPQLQALHATPDGALTVPSLAVYLRLASACTDRELAGRLTGLLCRNLERSSTAALTHYFRQQMFSDSAFELITLVSRQFGNRDHPGAAQLAMRKLADAFCTAAEDVDEEFRDRLLQRRMPAGKNAPTKGLLQAGHARFIHGLDRALQDADVRRIACRVSELHGFDPEAVADSRDSRAWRRFALDLFVGNSREAPCRVQGNIARLDVHDLGVPATLALLETFIGEGRAVELTVGGLTHGSTRLRDAIARFVRDNHPTHQAQLVQGQKVWVSTPERAKHDAARLTPRR